MIVVLLSSGATAESYWQQFVHYTMDIQLNPDEHQVTGKSRIVYVNNSPDQLDRIYMHLYPLAFKKGSVKYREYSQNYGRRGRAARFIEDGETLWNDFVVDSFLIVLGDGKSTTDYQIDDTILESRLPGELLPGDSLVIYIDWTHTVGEQFERAGYVGEQYNMAQWYPKLVVYDEKGWHPDPFHAEGEFYGEFGTFDVTLDLPARYIVGATGVVSYGDPGWREVAVDTSRDFSEWLKEFEADRSEPDSSARRVVSFHAENVHDFAWIASPTFLYEHGSWNGIDVHVLYNRSNGEKWFRVVRERSERALEWLSNKFGMYPYPQVTVTDRLRGGGMEYPMLVMNGSEREGLIVHEIGHIWFYGILANNEVDEAWLDEGFTSFQTRWYLENRYPKGIDFISSDYKPYQRKFWRFASMTENNQWYAIRFITSGRDEPISRSSYLFDNSTAYRMNAYTKPALMLNELRYVLGDSLFLRGMQTYFNRWMLKHVNEQRFVSVMEEVSGQELDWFFNGWLHDTQVLDYGIQSWKKEKISDDNWKVTLTLRNLGQRFLPLEIETKLKDGTVVRNSWKNHLWRFKDTFSYTVPSKPVQVVLDPDIRTLDIDYRNNVTGRLKREYVFRWPGMYYNPRDRYVFRWSPSMPYHEKDGFMPGLYVSKDYGQWEHTDIRVNYALVSQRFYWSVDGYRRPVHNPLNVRIKYYAHDNGGVAGFGGSIVRRWSRKYGIPPFHRWTAGFYFSNAKDTSRTDLYDPGMVTVLYGKYGMEIMSNDLVVEVSAAPGGWSDWTFSRLTATVNTDVSQDRIGIRNRFVAGFMWSDSLGVPGQERYTIEGAGSGDRYERPYLRDESSLYGFTELRNRYHLAGDVNLRGYIGKGYVGAEKVIANSIEAYYSPNTSFLSVEVAGFFDGGFLWGSEFAQNDNGFKGDFLADAGVGFRFSKEIMKKRFYLRIDFPFWISRPGQGENSIDFTRWIISFEKGI